MKRGLRGAGPVMLTRAAAKRTTGAKPAARASAARVVARARKAPIPPGARPLAERVRDTLSELERLGTAHDRANLVRFGIDAPLAWGVSMANIQKLAKRLGREHALAQGLWESGAYEARLLVAFVAEPARLTITQMDRWCRDFDNWGVCDTLCFKLFDQSPHAWGRVRPWAVKRPEFVKRSGIVLLACLALHDKSAPDARFLEHLKLLERVAADDRNFVKKAVSWALRAIGRRNARLHQATLGVCQRLSASPDPGARWAAADAARELRRLQPASRS